MSAKTSHRRTARKQAAKLATALSTGYATFGQLDVNGRYATFGLPYSVRASR
jgi:hypothetical protein